MLLRHAARSLLAPQNPIARSSICKENSTLARSSISRRPASTRMYGATAEGSSPSNSCSSSSSSSAGSSQIRGPGFIRSYLHLLEKHPILTKSTTAASIFLLADGASQGMRMIQADEAESIHWDVGRSLRMVGAGLFLSGPTLHLWFNLMSRTFPKRDVASTLKKMALGQTIYGPIFNTVFFSLNAYLQGESTSDVIARLKRDLLPTLKSGLVYWPLCDFLTYRRVPVHLQPLVNNSFAFLWTIYLTYMASLKKVASISTREFK